MAVTLIYPFANPSYRQITQPFGPTANTAEPPYPDTPQTQLWVSTNGAQGTQPAIAHYHRGVDFAVPSGTPILAAAAGTVEFAGWDTTGYGNMVGIKHAGGWATLYGHNQSLSVNTGDTVTQGQVISVSDSTGSSMGPHLHFGLNLLGSVFNDAGWTNPIPALGDAAIPNPQPYTQGLGGAQINSTVPGYITLNQAVYYARQAGLPEAQVPTAAAIAQAESGLQIAATNPSSGAAGLWQILPSAHPEYDVARLKSDPAYNAQAMVEVWTHAPNGGDNWTPWATYTSGAYTQYLAAAQTAAANTPFGQFPQSTPGAAPIPIDTSPAELPVELVTIQPVTLDRSTMVRKPGLLPTAGVQIGRIVLPVTTCQFTEPQYRTAGSWQATLPLSVFDSADGGEFLQALFARNKTQVTLLMGYVPPKRNGQPDPRDARPVFTGLAYVPEINDDTGMVTLNGPDMSGIFSDQSATASKLKSFMNMPADQAIRSIVQRHFTNTSQAGISTVIDPMAGQVGGLFGQDAVQTRTPIRTEWDVILSLADGEGCVAYFQGTTLYVRRVPPDGPPITLYHRMPAKKGPLVKPRFRPMPHSKRDYAVVVYSYDTKQGKVRQAVAGNVDSPNVIEIYLAPNAPQQNVQKRADSTYAMYSAMEYQADLSFVEPVDLVPTQPIIIETAAPYAIYKYLTGKAHPYYPLAVTTSYDVNQTGISISAQCTNRSPAIQDNNTAGAIAI